MRDERKKHFWTEFRTKIFYIMETVLINYLLNIYQVSNVKKVNGNTGCKRYSLYFKMFWEKLLFHKFNLNS